MRYSDHLFSAEHKATQALQTDSRVQTDAWASEICFALVKPLVLLGLLTAFIAGSVNSVQTYVSASFGSMGICMFRASLAVLAALLLVGVLSVLIVESRAVNEAYYVAHADRMRAIETSKNDLTAIMQGAKSAFDDGRTVSASTELALSRLAENNTLLQSADERLRSNTAVDTQLSTYESQLGGFIKNGQEFTASQNAFASALRTLQDESPLVVKDLRRYNLRLESQNAFSLAIEVIEFATGGEWRRWWPADRAR